MRIQRLTQGKLDRWHDLHSNTRLAQGCQGRLAHLSRGLHAFDLVLKVLEILRVLKRGYECVAGWGRASFSPTSTKLL